MIFFVVAYLSIPNALKFLLSKWIFVVSIADAAAAASAAAVVRLGCQTMSDLKNLLSSVNE